MKYLVTGASGPFATAAIEEFLKSVPAQDLILMSRKPDKLGKWAKLGCATRYGDFKEPNSVEAAAQGADKMLMISGYEVGHRILQHGNTIDAAVRAGVKHIAYTSYYGKDGVDDLACIDHRGTEDKLKSCGAAYTSLRDGMYMESIISAFLPNFYQAGFWITCTNGGKISMADRLDCAACAVHVLTSEGHENKIYEITGNDTWSFDEINDLAEEITGVHIEYRDVSDQEFYKYMKGLGIPDDSLEEFNVNGLAWCLNDIMSSERVIRAGGRDIVSNDIKSILGREPVKFRDFMWKNAERLRAIAKEHAKK